MAVVNAIISQIRKHFVTKYTGCTKICGSVECKNEVVLQYYCIIMF